MQFQHLLGLVPHVLCVSVVVIHREITMRFSVALFGISPVKKQNT